MTPMKLACSALALAIGASTVPAAAQQAGSDDGPPERMERMFEMLDADGDGAVTREEFEAAPSRRIAGMDADGDGQVSKAELEAVMVERAKARAEAMMARIDADGDGAASVEEFEKAGGSERRERRREKMFERIDVDDDGAVTRAEAEAAWARMAERHRDGRGHGKGMGQD
jgi:Ca2+-binding EF-hand superfamily protein